MSIIKGYVSFSDGQLHYRYAVGRGIVPSIFLHQTASSSAMFSAVMERLDDVGSMYAFDTPGFGGSSRPSVKPDVSYYVQSLLEGIEALGIKEFNLFGHHTGAAIACQMAAEHPDKVRRLGMIGPVQLTAEERSGWYETAIKPLQIDQSATHLEQVWQRVTNLDSQPIAYPVSAELATREAIDTLIAGDRWHEAYEAVFSQDFPAFLSKVRCPILMVCGDGDVLYPYFRRACEARPDAKAIELQAGAYVLDQEPDVMADLIRNFFRG